MSSMNKLQCQPVASVGSRQRLRSATRGDLVISPAQLSRTLVPGHLPLQDPKPGIVVSTESGISFRQTFVRLTQSTPLKAL